MKLWRQSREAASREFRRISIRQIRKNPYQPRKLFDAAALRELADSIAAYGVITPLTVRRTEDGFELVAGERRLRAASLAGLTTVPCYIVEADDRQSSLMALLENLQREDLDCFEEAASLLRLCQEFHMTQKEAAEQVGKTQSAVANKLRLLKLGAEATAEVRQQGLSERHARALLRLEEDRRALAARQMGQKQMTVAQAEQYVERLLQDRPPAKRQVVLRDIRLFGNALERHLQTLREAGFRTRCARRTEGEDTVFEVRITAGMAGNPPALSDEGGG